MCCSWQEWCRKSSIVELLVRTINNLAAVMLGEGYNFSAAEHLHFIDYVFADLCFQIGNVVYILEAHGRHVTLKYYKASIKHYFIYKPYRHYYLLDQNSIEKLSIPLKKHREGRRILKTLFYTMVCNYSLYGFNYRDFFRKLPLPPDFKHYISRPVMKTLQKIRYG